MRKPPMDVEGAVAFLDAVEAALRAGHKPPGMHTHTGERGALRVAGAALGYPRGSVFTAYKAAVNATGREADWSLYTGPKPRVRVKAGTIPVEVPQTPDDFERVVARRAALQGYAPEYGLTHEAPEGLTMRGTSVKYDAEGNVQDYWNKTTRAGREPEDTVQLADPKKIVKVSTLYDPEGRVAQQWVSEKPEDVAKERLWLAFAKALAADMPRAAPVPMPEHAAADLLAALPVGDHHMGMLSWDRETGANYDMTIAENLLNGAFDYLLHAMPACDTALIALLGDFQHYDSFETVTPTSRHLLDADGRYPKMIETSIRAIRYTIDATLRRHKTVHVIVEIGNHDLSTSIFMALCLAAIYENEPRVTIDTSPAHFHYFEFGNVLIGTHHGHGAKMEKLPTIMATDKPEAWGRTKHRHWFTGHIHHAKSKSLIGSAEDYVGCTVESFRVLAPTDAWAAQKGYRSIRDMKVILYHREFGEVARHTVNPNMLEKVAA